MSESEFEAVCISHIKLMVNSITALESSISKSKGAQTHLLEFSDEFHKNIPSATENYELYLRALRNKLLKLKYAVAGMIPYLDDLPLDRLEKDNVNALKILVYRKEPAIHLAEKTPYVSQAKYYSHGDKRGYKKNRKLYAKNLWWQKTYYC